MNLCSVTVTSTLLVAQWLESPTSVKRVVRSILVKTFSLSHARDIMNLTSFLFICQAKKCTIFLYLFTVFLFFELPTNKYPVHL